VVVFHKIDDDVRVMRCSSDEISLSLKQILEEKARTSSSGRATTELRRD
jgi:hypothetical protein